MVLCPFHQKGPFLWPHSGHIPPVSQWVPFLLSWASIPSGRTPVLYTNISHIIKIFVASIPSFWALYVSLTALFNHTLSHANSSCSVLVATLDWKKITIVGRYTLASGINRLRLYVHVLCAEPEPPGSVIPGLRYNFDHCDPSSSSWDL